MVSKWQRCEIRAGARSVGRGGSAAGNKLSRLPPIARDSNDLHRLPASSNKHLLSSSLDSNTSPASRPHLIFNRKATSSPHQTSNPPPPSLASPPRSPHPGRGRRFPGFCSDAHGSPAREKGVTSCQRFLRSIVVALLTRPLHSSPNYLILVSLHCQPVSRYRSHRALEPLPAVRVSRRHVGVSEGPQHCAITCKGKTLTKRAALLDNGDPSGIR